VTNSWDPAHAHKHVFLSGERVPDTVTGSALVVSRDVSLIHILSMPSERMIDGVVSR